MFANRQTQIARNLKCTTVFFSQLEISPPFCGSQQAVITFDFCANQLAACRAQSIAAAVTRDQTNQQAPRTVRSGEGGGGEIAGCASGIDRHVPKQRNQFAAAVISCAGRICHDAYFLPTTLWARYCSRSAV